MRNLIILILLLSLVSANNTNVSTQLTYEEVIQDTIEIIPDTLMMDTIYLDQFSTRIHYKGKTQIKDTTGLRLVIDTCDYAIPVGGRHGSKVGWRSGHYHAGIDISHNYKDTIHSCFEGIVRYSKRGYNGGYGNLVIIRHFNGLESYYAHQREIFLQVGDTVLSGTKIGTIGSTGRSTGPHLHFELRYLGKPIEPNDIFNFEEGTLRTDSITIKNTHYKFVLL